jgi:hypothetical protein
MGAALTIPNCARVRPADMSRGALRQRDAYAGRGGDQPVADRRLEDGRHPAVDELDRTRRQVPAQRFHPGLDLAPTDGTDGPAAESGIRMQAQVALGLSSRARPVDWPARHASA